YTGDPALLISQFLGILVTLAFVVIGGFIIGFIVKAVYDGNLRVSVEDEARGLDVASHGESAYPAYLGMD
ncbi:MAG: ammonium transporter, partial [Eggerthellaceae bacterium]|nr:ammonium transporter [Eggerthellaceae bacterium]